MTQAAIIDLDGTSFDPSARLHFLDLIPKDWGSFFDGMIHDPVIEPIAVLVRALHRHGIAVLIVTARPDENDYRQVSETKLVDNDIPYNKVYMRKAGDTRPDYIVKSEILQDILDDGYEPILAIDDSARVTEMWRSFGIMALQCAADEGRRSPFAGQTLLDITVGPAGSGKSTYCAKHYKPHEVLSSDKIRDELFGGHENGEGLNPDDMAKTWKYLHGLAKTRLENGLLTVVDSTAIKTKDRKNLVALAPKGTVVRYLVFDRSYDQKIKDRGWRDVKLIDRHHNIFKSNIKDILNADLLPNVIVEDKREHKI